MWLQIIYFQFSTLHQQIYHFNILDSPYSKHYAPLYSGDMLDNGTYIWAIKEAQSFPEKLICCDQSTIAASSMLPHVFTQFGGAHSMAHHN